MKRMIAIATFTAAAAPLWSQTIGVTEPAMPAIGIHGPADQVVVHSAGIRLEGPLKKGAAYSAEAITETVQTLADGNRIRRENKAKVYRDNEGRTRREETLEAVGPWAVAGEPMTRIFINDPVAGEHWVLEPERKIARKMKMPSFGENLPFGVASAATFESGVAVALTPPGGRPGPGSFERRIEERRVEVHQVTSTNMASPPGDAPNVEDLGTRMIEGVEAKGSKTTRTIPAGQIGNERPIEIVFEQWRSEELGVDVYTKRSDPRMAETTYKLVNIQRTEPLPGLFQPPADYEVHEGHDNFIMRRLESTRDDK